MSNSFVVTFDKILKFSRTYVGKLQKAREWGQFFRLGRGKIFFYLLDTEAALHAARQPSSVKMLSEDEVRAFSTL